MIAQDGLCDHKTDWKWDKWWNTKSARTPRTRAVSRSCLDHVGRRTVSKTKDACGARESVSDWVSRENGKIYMICAATRAYTAAIATTQTVAAVIIRERVAIACRASVYTCIPFCLHRHHILLPYPQRNACIRFHYQQRIFWTSRRAPSPFARRHQRAGC